jgi:hypothetical protein
VADDSPGNGKSERLDVGPFHLVAKRLTPVLITLGLLVIVVGPVASVFYLVFIHDPRTRVIEREQARVKEELQGHAAEDGQRFSTLTPVVNCNPPQRSDADRWWEALRADQRAYLRERGFLTGALDVARANDVLNDREYRLRPEEHRAR